MNINANSILAIYESKKVSDEELPSVWTRGGELIVIKAMILILSLPLGNYLKKCAK